LWPDNETSQDFLNFSGVAETVAEIIVQAHGRPISIGVSGAWGIGKSSMIKLTQGALEKRPRDDDDREFVFVEFNAWLYQGYDDARAALMDVIASKLQEEAEARSTGLDKVKDLASRVKWLRVAKLFAAPAAALALGVPLPGMFGGVAELGKAATGGEFDGESLDKAQALAGDVSNATTGIIGEKPYTSPPQEIQALRDSFEDALEELGITLVVLVDDLDRCLPETTISTLEAIRLFLFLRNTAFVVAADNEMIKHAVKRHFEGVTDDQLITSYFDKLIQVPIQVPALGTQEVRAYMMLLYVENSGLDAEVREDIRIGVCEQLKKSWQGKRVDRAFVESLYDEMPPALLARLETADRLAPLMATASGIQGNPRLIKRFLNALAIRLTISKAQGVGVDEAVLAKLLLFERLGDPTAYADLISKASANDQGHPEFMSSWEEDIRVGKELELDKPWEAPFVLEWLALQPPLGGQDIRGALYVGREHTPLILPEDRLSSEAASVLEALLTEPRMARSAMDDIGRIGRSEMSVIMDRLLDRARREQNWGVPDILEACMVVAEADPVQGPRLATFLTERPVSQIEPNIIPKIRDQPWATSVFKVWLDVDVSGPVKKAIGKGSS